MHQLASFTSRHAAACHTAKSDRLAERQAPVQTDFCILVQDYAPHGDLYSHLRKQRIRFSEKKLVSLVMQPCLEALAYLHERNIIHRDIKPENLLLDENFTIKLADFGLSVCTSDEHPVTRAGTLDYMAPEVLVCPLKRLPTDYKGREDLAYTTKVDSWSLGVLAYELLTGRPPFQHRDEDDLLQALSSSLLPPPYSALLCCAAQYHVCLVTMLSSMRL